MVIAEYGQERVSSLNPTMPRSENELEELFGVPIVKFYYSFTSAEGAPLIEDFYVRIKEQPFSTVAFSVLDKNGERVFLCEGHLHNNKFYAVTSDKATVRNGSKICLANPETSQRSERVCEHNKFPSRYLPRIGAHSIANIIIGMQLDWQSSDYLEKGGKELYTYIQDELSQQITTIPPSPADNIFHYSLTPRQIAI